MKAEICDFLEKNCAGEDCLDQELNLSEEDFLIIKKVELNTNSKDSSYFKIIFKELRSDIYPIQLTPSLNNVTGFLEVKSDGALQVLDKNEKPYVSTRIFTWDSDEKRLKSETNVEASEQEQTSSLCFRGLATLGLFATGALIAYTATNCEVSYHR